MGETSETSRARVVDLAAYRTARARQPLPLTEEHSAAGNRLAPAQPAYALDGRQIAHRERMLRHLASGRT